MQEVLSYLLDALVAVVCGILARYAIPYVKTLWKNANWAALKEKVETLVDAAEQTIQGSGLGAEKKAWVISMLEAAGVVVDDMIDALIEKTVLLLNQVQEGLEKESGD